MRVCCSGEKPVLTEGSKSQEEDLAEKHGLPRVNKDGSLESNYND